MVLAVTMIVTFFSDPFNWMPETPRQKNANVFRQAELEVQQAHGGLSPAQQKELDDLRQLNERRRRRDSRSY